MNNKINNLSDVFREAKKHLWDGEYLSGIDNSEVYICHSIDKVRCSRALVSIAKDIVMSRFPARKGKSFPHDVDSFLTEVLGVSVWEQTCSRVQQYRKDWLTALEEEFKPKLKPKKGYSIHHIDGDVGNNDLSNLTYVKTNEYNNWK